LNTFRTLTVLVLLDALYMAAGHVPLIRVIFFSFSIGAYFLLATVIYVLGGIFLLAGKMFKLANFSLILLALIDNILLVYTRTMPNIFFHKALPWSWGWFLPGTGQILVGQCVIIVLCAIVLYKPLLVKG
jgi:hypothetical protein